MQAVFTSKQFLQGAFHTRAQKLLGRLVGMLKGLMPNASRYVGFAGLKDIEEWIKAAVKLKQTLMISPQDYRIHFCPVGKPFDSTWMKAEDKEGLPVNDAQAKDRTVAACFFPALIEKKPVAFPKDVKLEDILVTNKVFLPSVDEIEALNPIMVVAKATVLVTTGISK